MHLICECSDDSCREVIDLSLEEVLFLRGPRGDRAILIPGHQEEDEEILGTDSLGRFVVVQDVFET